MFIADDTRGPRFALLEARDLSHPAWLTLNLTATRLLVLITLHVRGNERGWVLSTQTMAEKTGRQVRQVISALNDLEEAGFLKRVYRYMPAIDARGVPVSIQGHVGPGYQVASAYLLRSPCETYRDYQEERVQIVDNRDPARARVLDEYTREPVQRPLPVLPEAMENSVARGAVECTPTPALECRHTVPSLEPETEPPQPLRSGGALDDQLVNDVHSLLTASHAAHPGAGIFDLAQAGDGTVANNLVAVLRARRAKHPGAVPYSTRLRDVRRAMVIASGT